MAKIIRKEILAEKIKRLDVLAPEIAKKALPGQFVVLRIDEKGERIPLTIAEKNLKEGTISLIFQEIGATTKRLGSLVEGEEILNLAGPLGKPSEIKNYGGLPSCGRDGKVIAIGGGVGTAVVYPLIYALKEAGNVVFSILGAKSKNFLILEKELREISDKFFLTTDDGSAGEKGFVSDVLKKLLEGEKIDLVITAGPLMMMKVISQITEPYKIKTVVSLNPIMVDGTGMCGSCRVRVGGESKFVCVDGPEFDGHLVDFDTLIARSKLFSPQEKTASEKCKHADK